jgi:hypothetical protein
MVGTMRNRADRRGGLIGVSTAAMTMTMAIVLGLGMFPAPATGQEKPAFEVWDFGVVPRPSVMMGLLGTESVQQELKLTDAQKQEQQAIIARLRDEMMKKMQEARRNTQDREKLLAVQAAIGVEFQAAIRKSFTPEQWERLDQIQLQAQGPLAFSLADQGPGSWMRDVGPPLAGRLKLSDDQMKRIRAIATDGEQEISRAASFPIPLDPKDKPTKEDIRKLVESPEFQAAKKRASQAGREAWAAVIRRIEEVLTESQRQDYHKLLGAPFDVTSLNGGAAVEQERQFEINRVVQALGGGAAQGGGGGQRADPDFKTKVDRPAYAAGPRHPRVLFDEAHHNFHTASGRYKPFAELMTSDGYLVIPNREKFTREVLDKGDILVIANALASEQWAPDPAFTDAEGDAVRDWVRDGGALLLIADHAPFGSAARGLAKRFGVDLSTGAVSDPANSADSPSFLVFSRQNHLLGDNPITRGRDDSERVNKVQTFTGTSLKGPEESVPILKLADTAIDHSLEGGGESSARGRVQGLALPFARGRVVVMGEAAELSAQLAGVDGKFGMNVPGIDNRQLALNIMHWLSGLLEPREPALKKAG